MSKFTHCLSLLSANNRALIPHLQIMIVLTCYPLRICMHTGRRHHVLTWLLHISVNKIRICTNRPQQQKAEWRSGCCSPSSSPVMDFHTSGHRLTNVRTHASLRRAGRTVIVIFFYSLVLYWIELLLPPQWSWSKHGLCRVQNNLVYVHVHPVIATVRSTCT